MDIPPSPIYVQGEMFDFCEEDQDTDRHSVTVPACICTCHHMTEKHWMFNHESRVNVHVDNKVVNHILQRHGPDKCVLEYNVGSQDYYIDSEMVPNNYAIENLVQPYDCDVDAKLRRVWNRPTIFLQGWINVVRMTLINPDIIEPGSGRHNQRHTLYCKEFDYPIGIDNIGNLLHICKVVVSTKRTRTNLVTAYPLRKQSLDKCQTECTVLCDVFREFDEEIK